MRVAFRVTDTHRDSSVSIVTMIQVGSLLGIHPILKRSERMWGPSASYLVGSGGISSMGVKRLGMKLTTYLHPVLRLRMSGAVPLLPLNTFTEWMGTN